MKTNYLRAISVTGGMIILAGMMFINIPMVSAAPPPNLILNSSLEDSSVSGVPDNWQSGSWGSAVAQFHYPVEGSTGTSTKAANIVVSSYGAGGDAKWFFNEVPAMPGAYYSFSDKYQSTINTRAVVRFNMGSCDTVATDCNYQEIGRLTPATNWQNFKFYFTAPVGAVSMTVFHLLEGVGELTVDDYSLMQTEHANSFSHGMVSLTFDDGWKSVYDNAIPILDAAGFKSTQNIISSETKSNRVGSYMTSGEVLALANNGHDIAGHTMSHVDLTLATLSASKFQKEIAGARYDLLTRLPVKPVDSMAYPYGNYNNATELAAEQAGFLGARTVDFGFNDKLTDRFALKTLAIVRGGTDPTSTPSLVASTTLAEITDAIDTAAANKTWLILTMHQVDHVNSDVYGMTPEMLQDIVNYLKNKDIAVKTMSEALHLMPDVTSNDNIAPVIATSSDVTVESTSSHGAIVNFNLPIVTDNNDPNLSPYCSTNKGTVSGAMFPLGSTQVNCVAMDTSGNLATTTSFNVIVKDLTPPVITLLGSSTIAMLVGDTYQDAGATVMDNIDGTSTIATTTGDVITTSTPAGTYHLNYNAQDMAGNIATTTTRTINISNPVNNNGAGNGYSGSSGGSYYASAPAVTSTSTVIATNKQVLGIKIAQAASEMSDYIQSEAEMIFNFRGIVQFNNEGTMIYNKVITKSSSLAETDKNSTAYFIMNGTNSTMRLGAGERAGVLKSFEKVYGHLPQSLADWNDVIKIANGRWVAVNNLDLEKTNMNVFKLIYGRMPNFSNINDETAIKLMTYGLRPVGRNINSEKDALKSFLAIYKHFPMQAMDWDILRAIAYSGAKK